jgi:hypothetical protein
MSFKLSPRSGGGPYQNIDGKCIMGYDMQVDTENSSEAGILEKIAMEGIKIKYCNRSFEVRIRDTSYSARLVMDPTLSLVDVFLDDASGSILRYQESQKGANTLESEIVPENLIKDEIISTIKNATETELNNLEKRLLQIQSRL